MSTIRRALCCCVLLSALGLSLSAPASRFDQRQEGDVNVRAKLGNFIVVIIPTSATGDTTIPIGGILSLFLNRQRNSLQAEDRISHDAILPTDSNNKLQPGVVVVSTAAAAPALASVHVNTLDKPDDAVPAVEITYEQVQAALLSPSTLAVPPTRRDVPVRGATTLAVPVRGVATEQVKKAKAISTTLKSRLKERNLLEERIKQLSADIEVCAPDQRRDEDGNCEPLTSKHRSEPHAFSGALTPDVLSFGLSPATD